MWGWKKGMKCGDADVERERERGTKKIVPRTKNQKVRNSVRERRET